MDSQDVTEDYEQLLTELAKRIRALRLERGLTLRDMVAIHGSRWRRMERESGNCSVIDPNR